MLRPLMIDPLGCPVESRSALVRLLRLAYSGELAAAYAYAGHWRSVRDPVEREEIRRIECEELEHRACNLAMLRALSERLAVALNLDDVRCVLVSDGSGQRGALAAISSLAEIPSTGDVVHVDVTHGPRAFPIVGSVSEEFRI